MYFTKDVFAILSIVYILNTVFPEKLFGGRISFAVCSIIPLCYSFFGSLFLKERIDFTYELLDAISNFYYIAAMYIFFRRPPLIKATAVVFVYIFTVDMLWSFAADIMGTTIIAECLFNIAVFAAVAFFVRKMSADKENNVLLCAFREVPKWMVFALLLFELTCYYKEFGVSSSWYDFLYAVSAIMIFVCIAALVMKIMKNINTQNEIMRRLNEQILYAEEASRSDEALRSFRHDMKNHFIVINSMFAQGDSTGAKAYFEKISDGMKSTVNSFSTGNSVLNAILNVKKEEAEGFGIKIDFSGMVPQDIVEGKDICISMGNLIDNAIEGCKKTDDKTEKTVKIKSVMKNNALLISVTNPYNTDYVKKRRLSFQYR